LISGYAVGVVGCLLGLILTINADLPAGAVIVLSLAAVALLFALLVKPIIGRTR